MSKITYYDQSDPRPCQQCGEEFQPSNYNKNTGTYCSPKCKQKAYRERKKAKRGNEPTPAPRAKKTPKEGRRKAQLPPWARWDKKARMIHRLRKGCKKGTRVHFGAARAVVKGGFADPCGECFSDFDQAAAKKVRLFSTLAGKYSPPT